MATFEEAYRIKKRLTARLLKHPDVYGVGIGYANPRRPSDGAGLIVYAKNSIGNIPGIGLRKRETKQSGRTGVPVTPGMLKTDPNASAKRGAKRRRKPATKLRPKSVLPIRFVSAGQFKCNLIAGSGAAFRKKIRPVPAGYSVGTPEGSGTAGLIVVDYPRRAQRYVCSNNHVLNEDNSPSGSETIQPGGADNGKSGRDRIGRLHRFVRLSRRGPNYLDAAMSVPQTNGLLAPRYAVVGSLPGHVTSYRVGERLVKVGRTTGFVRGTVESVNTDIKVDYGSYGGLGTITLRNQSVIKGSKPVSLPGDSGSAWLRAADRYAAALNYAGSDNGLRSIAFPIHWIMQAFRSRVAKPNGGGSEKRVNTGGSRSYVRPLTNSQLAAIRLVTVRR